MDGLRLDAVHAIDDDSERHILHEIADRARAAAPERHIHLIVENEDNDATLLARDAGGRPCLYTAQWNADIHHVLHVDSTVETFGYYEDYGVPSAVLGAIDLGYRIILLSDGLRSGGWDTRRMVKITRRQILGSAHPTNHRGVPAKCHRMMGSPTHTLRVSVCSL